MANEPCGCGSNLPLIARVDGRDSDIVSIQTETGVRELSAGLFEVAVETLLDVREYQLIQAEDNRVRVLLEPLDGKSFDRERAENTVRNQLHANGIDAERALDFEVVDHLEAPPDGKFKRVTTDEAVAQAAS